MNVTKHGLYRFLTRIQGNFEFSTEEQFVKYIKSDNSLYEKKKKEFDEHISNIEFVDLGIHKIKNHESCKYLLDVERKHVFLIKDNTLVTCLVLNYVPNEQGNNMIFQGYLESLLELEKKSENIDNLYQKKKYKYELYIKESEFEIKKLNLKIAELQKIAKQNKEYLKDFETKKELVEEEIKIVIEKMLVM